MGKYTNWSKVKGEFMKLEKQDFDEIKEVWKHDHVDDLYAYYGSTLGGKGKVRISEFMHTIHYSEEFMTVEEAEKNLRLTLQNNPYIKGMEVWVKTNYGLIKSLIVDTNYRAGDYFFDVKVLETYSEFESDVVQGETTQVEMEDIDEAEDMSPVERRQMRNMR